MLCLSSQLRPQNEILQFSYNKEVRKVEQQWEERQRVSPKMAVGTKGSSHTPITRAEVGGGKRVSSK